VKIRVLGSAAGGGFPQWNCNCRNCSGLRAGTLRARARTQSSIAVCGQDARRWVLVNASPDILTQLRAAPALQPARAARDTAIAAVVLVDAQIDHTVGLFMLRESTRPLELWCSDAAYADLTRGNPVLTVLDHYCGIERHGLPHPEEAFTVAGLADLSWRALPVPGKPAPFSPHRAAPVAGDNVALVVRDAGSGRSVLYAPGLGAIDPLLRQAMHAADCLLLDGTFWSEDEMSRQGLGAKRARDMGHLPQSGPGGMLAELAQLPEGKRRILIHVNNSNPILDEDSPERRELERAGVEVAHDGLEIEL
jgi:pyrroloquinoline quinone biosynthesis protein B